MYCGEYLLLPYIRVFALPHSVDIKSHPAYSIFILMYPLGDYKLEKSSSRDSD